MALTRLAQLMRNATLTPEIARIRANTSAALTGATNHNPMNGTPEQQAINLARRFGSRTQAFATNGAAPVNENQYNMLDEASIAAERQATQARIIEDAMTWLGNGGSPNVQITDGRTVNSTAPGVDAGKAPLATAAVVAPTLSAQNNNFSNLPDAVETAPTLNLGGQLPGVVDPGFGMINFSPEDLINNMVGTPGRVGIPSRDQLTGKVGAGRSKEALGISSGVADAGRNAALAALIRNTMMRRG